MKDKIIKWASPTNAIFYLSWFLCFSIALPHTILPGKAGAISFLIFILWLIEGRLKEKIKVLCHSKLFISIVGFILLLSLSMLWTEYTSTGLVRLSAFKYYLFLIPVLITSINKQDALKLIYAFVLGTIAHAILMILFSNGLINLPEKVTLYSPYSVYSPFFVFSLFYCFYYFSFHLKRKEIVRSLFLLLCSFVLLYEIFTNPGRSGQIAFLCSTLTALILLHKSWLKTSILLVTVASTILIISLSSDTVTKNYLSALKDIKGVAEGNYNGSWGARWGLLVTNTKVIINNPLIGVGLGDTQDAMQRVIARSKDHAPYYLAFFDGSHNHYITIFTSAGIIGFITYILIHIFLYRLPIRNHEIKNLSLIFLIILIITSISDDILMYKPFNIFFAIMISLFINLSLANKDRKEKST